MSKLVVESLNELHSFEKSDNKLDSLNIGRVKERKDEKKRQNIIARELTFLNMPRVSGSFKADYILTKDSSEEEIEKFRKDSYQLGKLNLSPGMIPLLIKGVRSGYVACISVAKPTYGNGVVPTNYFYWYTIDGGCYDPEDIYAMQNEIENALKNNESLNELHSFEQTNDPLDSLNIGRGAKFEIVDPDNLGFKNGVKKAILKFNIDNEIIVDECYYELDEESCHSRFLMSDGHTYSFDDYFDISPAYRTRTGRANSYGIVRDNASNKEYDLNTETLMNLLENYDYRTPMIVIAIMFYHKTYMGIDANKLIK
jgi:hypothetical protein